jgi:hypothetical protein
MEPKPRGINPENSSQPEWIKQARSDYARNEHCSRWTCTKTNISRGEATIEMLDKLLPTLKHNPNILIVGLGLDHSITPSQCYEPFRISAYLEKKNINYQMTLVDLSELVINDVKNRTKLSILTTPNDINYRNLRMQSSWQQYLEDTNQKDHMSPVKSLRPGNPPTPYDQILHTAGIPKQFRTKLENGDIQLVNSDIAEANLDEFDQFDYAELTNVLYLMSLSGKKLAVANIASHMKSGGLILLDDGSLDNYRSWLGMDKLNDLGLLTEKDIVPISINHAVLKKK